MESPTKTKSFLLVGTVVLTVLTLCSFFVGKYPLTLSGLLSGDAMQWQVFLTLRASRAVIGAIGGFVLGVTGFVYQTVFRNPLASPDIIGASSGASVGAAFGILFLPGAVAVTLSAFAGAICCVLLALTLSSLTAEKDGKSIVLSGIAVHSLAQTALVCLKLLADPEKQLASIEYWIMGSLNGISLYSIGGNIALCLICLVGMFLLYRQILLLSLDDQEGRLLGVNVTQIRLIVLLIATLAASSVISMTGLISFISLLAPHGARLLFKNNRLSTMLFSGLLGGCLLTLGDIFARSIASTELPVSIFTAGYAGKQVIKDISFFVAPKTIVGILGANGCGKTTLIKAIANLLPHTGSCQLDDTYLENASPRQLALLCGYIPQKSGISIDLTLLDVVLMGFNPKLSLLQSPTEQMKKEAFDALCSVGLGSRKDDNFQQLSEGQKQLCLLARTFVLKRRLLLLDEPESALDFRLRYETMGLLRTYVAKNNAAALVTLHDPSLALNYCDTLLVLSDCGLLGELQPFSTPISKMEPLLSSIYGTISLTTLSTRSGEKRLIMIKEDDAC